MIAVYEPKNWFWIVGGDDGLAWSSAAKAWVVEWPSDRMTRIANEVELFDVLSRAGMASRAPDRVFTVEEVRQALAGVDAEATGDAGDAGSLRAVAENLGMMLPPVIE